MIPGGQVVVRESIALLTLVLFVFFCRLASRWVRYDATHASRHRGAWQKFINCWRAFFIDDYLMTFNVALYLVCVYSIWYQVIWGNNYVTPDEVVGWTKSQMDHAIIGAKFGLVMEVTKITCVWGCKACLLILYFQMTKGLPTFYKACIAVSVFTAIAYVLDMASVLGMWCHPFHYYYDVIPLPPDKSECMTYKNEMIFDACVNIPSDAAILCLPLPLVVRAKLPLRRKIPLICIFSLGFVVILCAILNRVTNFIAFNTNTSSLVYLNWYEGEVSTAVIVANVPLLWPLVARLFRLGSFSQDTGITNPDTRRSTRNYQSVTRTKGYMGSSSESQIAESEEIRLKDVGCSEDLVLTVDKGQTTTSVMANGKDEGRQNFTSDISTPEYEHDLELGKEDHHIVKTVVVSQSRR